ncbi:uracil-DNA glycosylase [Fluviispira multicolorata]|uniref:Uracil-DNA glycosylase n=1 Tax=Fluviispira multicolorata TaxID=2654512 RepID=A0A833N4Z8_9BACT|nr:uracil-DNA glycosylase [Fluviispira multicolorata]
MKARDLSFLSDKWRKLLAAEFDKPYFEEIRSFLKGELKQGHTFFPEKNKIFRAFKLVDYENVRVVIIGQDPYHGFGQANGLSFAVEQGTPAPPSLNNIFKEIESDLGKGKPKNTHLENWAKQGILLLNTVLTVRANTAFSHREKGWEKFTDCVIENLNNKTTPVIFMLWGAAAQSKASMIKNPLHKILKAPHPSPLSAHRGFLGCKHFSKANEILKNLNDTEIDWTL